MAAAAPKRNLRNLARIVERYQQRGALQPEDPMDTVAALIGPLMTRDLQRRSSGALPAGEVDVPTYVERFLHGRRASAT